MDEMGYWLSFTRSKQRSISESSTICVPRRQSDWSSVTKDVARRPVDYDPASVLDLYFTRLMFDFQCQREDLKGSIFKGSQGVNGKRFTSVNVGKNTLGGVGVEVARELCLPHPESYTGHCWRRSAGTNASNAGVNVTTLMSMMGWLCPKTAMEYVKHSRLTSLQMSMYLANVQRQNVREPFPSILPNRRGNLFEKKKVEKVEKVCLNEKLSVDAVEVRDDAVVDGGGDAAVDDWVDAAVRGGEEGVDVDRSALENVPSGSGGPIVNLSAIDPRLATFFHNMNNSGNVNIHIHFAESK